jgi:hypothetical protein
MMRKEIPCLTRMQDNIGFCYRPSKRKPGCTCLIILKELGLYQLYLSSKAPKAAIFDF